MNNNGMLTLQQNQNAQVEGNQNEFTGSAVTQRQNFVTYPNDSKIS